MTPLFIWSQVHPVDLAPIKAAKAKLDAWIPVGEPERVKPAYLALDDGGNLIRVNFDYLSDRVLAVASRPPFLCNYALVSPRTSEDGWLAALSWVLSDEVHPKATTIEDTLNAILGPGVREIPPEEIEGMQRLREYQQNLV